MKFSKIIVVVGMVAGSVIASAQLSPEALRRCANTMTNDMRNCQLEYGQEGLKGKKSKDQDQAQGFTTERNSCNAMALNNYMNCGSEGIVQRPKPTPKTTAPSATATGAPKQSARKVQR